MGKKKVGAGEGERTSLPFGRLEFKTDLCFSVSDRGTGCGLTTYRGTCRGALSEESCAQYTCQQNLHMGVWEHKRGASKLGRWKVS